MRKRKEYYYRGDTYRIETKPDGIALDIINNDNRMKLYNDEYRYGLAERLKGLYLHDYGKELPIPTEDVSTEILLHAMAYDFSLALEDGQIISKYAEDVMPKSVWELPGSKRVATEANLLFNNIATDKAKNWLRARATTANIGIGDTERNVYDMLSFLSK